MKSIIRSPRTRWFLFGCLVTSMIRISVTSDQEEYEAHEVRFKVKIDSVRAWKFMTDTTVDHIYFYRNTKLTNEK